jgi:hypothetical protein
MHGETVKLDALISQIYFGMKLDVFRTVPLSIIRSLFTVHSAMVHVIQVCRQLSSRTRMEPVPPLHTPNYNAFNDNPYKGSALPGACSYHTDFLINLLLPWLTLQSPAVTLRTTRFNIQQDRQCTYNVTLRHVRVTSIAVENGKN